MLNAHVLVGRRTLLAVVGYRFVHCTARRYVCCVISPIRPETCSMPSVYEHKTTYSYATWCVEHKIKNAILSMLHFLHHQRGRYNISITSLLWSVCSFRSTTVIVKLV